MGGLIKLSAKQRNKGTGYEIFKNFEVRAPLETSHVPRLPICCDAGKALSPTVGLEALPRREQRRQRTKGLQPSCAQNRLAQNQNCIRLGLGRFSEVPLARGSV